MKNTKYFLAPLLIAAMFAFTSCDDDAFLEEKPTTFYTVDNIFSTAEQVDQVLISIYTHIRDLQTNRGESQWIWNLRFRGTDMYDVANIRSGDTFSDYSVINTTHSTFYEAYCTWYYVIARANLALYAADLPYISWGSDEQRAYAEGQARFFRALAYMKLGQVFGGVPIVTEIATRPRYDYVRTTRVQTYQFAIDEMEAILNDLPVTTLAGGRIVRGAAQHYLAELYLSLGTQLAEEGNSGAQAAFTTSINYASQLIDGTTYSLITERFGTRRNEETFHINVHRAGSLANVVDTVQFHPNHYWDMFQEGNVNYQAGNTETIWAHQINFAAYIAEDGGSRLMFPRSMGPIFRDLGLPGGTPVRGELEDAGGRGISNVNITMYTRDLIYADEFEKDMRNSGSVFRRRFKGNNPDARYYLEVVPWSFIYGGSDSEITNTNNRSIVYPISCKIATDRFTGIPQGQNRSHLFREDYMVRLAETILLRAEAKQRSGDKPGAAADVNLLRQRAHCDYLVTAADMDDSFDMILDERARELVYEEWRWNTLLRMGGTIAVDRIRKYAYWPITQATLTFNYNLWPIPQTIINVNRDVVLPQNPGWENR